MRLSLAACVVAMAALVAPSCSFQPQVSTSVKISLYSTIADENIAVEKPPLANDASKTITQRIMEKTSSLGQLST